MILLSCQPQQRNYCLVITNADGAKEQINVWADLDTHFNIADGKLYFSRFGYLGWEGDFVVYTDIKGFSSCDSVLKR